MCRPKEPTYLAQVEVESPKVLVKATDKARANVKKMGMLLRGVGCRESPGLSYCRYR